MFTQTSTRHVRREPVQVALHIQLSWFFLQQRQLGRLRPRGGRDHGRSGRWATPGGISQISRGRGWMHEPNRAMPRLPQAEPSAGNAPAATTKECVCDSREVAVLRGACPVHASAGRRRRPQHSAGEGGCGKGSQLPQDLTASAHGTCSNNACRAERDPCASSGQSPGDEVPGGREPPMLTTLRAPS